MRLGTLHGWLSRRLRRWLRVKPPAHVLAKDAYNTWSEAVFSFAVARLRAHVPEHEVTKEAQALTEQVFIDLFHAFRSTNPPADDAVWLFRRLRRLLVDRLAEPFNGEPISVSRPLLSSEALQGTSRAARELRLRVWQQLSDLERECMQLCTIGFTLRRVGAILNLSSREVAQMIVHAVALFDTAMRTGTKPERANGTAAGPKRP